MRTAIILSLFLAACLAYGSAQNFPSYLTHDAAPEAEAGNGNGEVEQSVAGTISTYVVDTITSKIQFLFELLDIKVRAVRFLASLYTTDNLVLLKKMMNLGLRFGNWLYSVIPDSTTEGQNTLLSFLFPQVDQPTDEEHSPVSDLTFGGLPASKEEDETPSTEPSRGLLANVQPRRNQYQNDFNRRIRNLNQLINTRRYY